MKGRVPLLCMTLFNPSSGFVHTNIASNICHRSVHIHGRTSFRPTRVQAGRLSPSTHSVGERPADPNSLSYCLPENVVKVCPYEGEGLIHSS